MYRTRKGSKVAVAAVLFFLSQAHLFSRVLPVGLLRQPRLFGRRLLLEPSDSPIIQYINSSESRLSWHQLILEFQPSSFGCLCRNNQKKKAEIQGLNISFLTCKLSCNISFLTCKLS